jgi:type III secretion protein N (ATPase)
MKATAPAAFGEGAASPDPLLHALARVQSIERVGRVAEAYGTLIRATGLKAAIGELCELRNPRGDGDPTFRLAAEVVGVSKQLTLLTPLGALDGVSATTEVYASGRQAAVRAPVLHPDAAANSFALQGELCGQPVVGNPRVGVGE